MESRDRIRRLRPEMKEDPPSSSLGLILIGLGSVALAWCKDIQSLGLGNNHDPGAKAFPIALSLCLILGGVRELCVWFRHRPAGFTDPIRNAWKERPHRNLTLLLLSLVVYLPLMNWAGFTVSTFLLATALAGLLGARWWSAIAGSVLLVAAVKLLFGLMFRVDLPQGSLGLNF